MRRRPIALLAAALLALAPAAGCGTTPEEPPLATVEATTFAPSLGVDLTAAGWTRTPSGLVYRQLAAPPAGAPTVALGDTVSVRYTGWLSSGQQFDSGVLPPPGQPPYIVGARQVIPGFDEGVFGMARGERRRLLIPPALGYGRFGTRGIPGNAVLVFDVEVLSTT